MAIFLGWFVTVPARAELSQYKGRYQMAMEIELQESLLPGLTPYVDWKKVQADIDSGHFDLDLELREKIKAEGKPLGECSRAMLASVFRRGVQLLPNYPPLTPEATRTGPFKDVEWHMDGDKVEFKFTGPTRDPADYLARLRHFAKGIGMEGKLDRPNDARLPEFSLHVHLSRVGGANLRSRVAALNHLILMRMVNEGSAGPLFDGSRTTVFSDDIDHRGVVRALSDDHFEIRRHTDTPEAELAEVLGWLDMPETQSLAEIRRATAALVTEKNLTSLFRYSVPAAAAVLAHAKPGLRDPRLAPAIAKLVTDNQVDDLLAIFRTLERNARAGMADSEALLRQTATAFQAYLKKRPLAEWFATAAGDIAVPLLKISAEFCVPPSEAVGPDHAAVAPAVQRLLRTPHQRYFAPSLVAQLIAVNPEVKEMVLAELAAGKVESTMLQPMLSALNPVLNTPEGWASVRQFLQVATPRDLAILRKFMAADGLRYSAGHLSEVRAAEATPVGSRPFPARPVSELSPVAQRNAVVPLGCRDAYERMRAVERVLRQ